ncbi:MAG: hypothetical protein PHI40_08490, partial [Caldisericia bacterium]|nr:hypothetical protein [Caldisericia bacterium]
TGYSATSALNNTALGYQSGYTNTTGSGDVFLGYQAGYYETGSNKLFIDNTKRASEADARLKSLVYGEFATATSDQVLRVNAKLGIVDSGSDHYTYLLGGNQSGDITYTLPTALPASNMVLQSTSAGVLSWVAQSGGTVGGTYGINVQNLSGSKTLTANTDKVYQYLNPNGSHRVVTLATIGAVEGDRFVIRNNGAYNITYYLRIYQGGTALDDIYAGTIKEYIYNGSNWISAENGTGEHDTKKNNTAIGYYSKAYSYGTAFGTSSSAYTYGVAVGHTANGYSYGVSVGSYSYGYNHGISVGYNTYGYSYGVAVGYSTIGSNYGVSVGSYAGSSQDTGFDLYNVFVGSYAGHSTQTGSMNTYLGYQSGYTNTTGSGDVFLGYQAGYYETGDDKLFIDNRKRASEADARTKALVYGIFDDAVANQVLAINAESINLPHLPLGTGDAGTVTIDSSGKLYVTSSSLRYKHDIIPFVENWSLILQTFPKAFKYDGSNQSDVGYIAEDFDALGLSDLVLYDKKGRPNAIKYDRITLYNTEILKQHQEDIDALKLIAGINIEGDYGSGALSGSRASNSITSLVVNLLSDTGITIQNGLTNIKNLAVTTFSAKTARMERMEIVDSATGDIYCTWIENGEWKRVKGDCGSIGEVSIVKDKPSDDTDTNIEKTITEQTKQIIEKANEAVEKAEQTTKTAEKATEKTQQAAEKAQKAVDKVEDLVSEAVEKSENDLKEETGLTEDEEKEIIEEKVELDSEPETEPEPEAEVELEAEPEPEPESILGDVVEDATAGLINATSEFIKWFFGQGFQKMLSLNIFDKAFRQISHETNIINNSIRISLEEKTPSLIENQTAGILNSFKNLWKMIKYMTSNSVKIEN